MLASMAALPLPPSPSFTSAAALHARPYRAHKHGFHPCLPPLQALAHPLLPHTPPFHHRGPTGPRSWVPSHPPFSTPEKLPIKTFGDLLTLSLLPPTPSLDANWGLIFVGPLRGIPVDQNLLQKLQQPKVIMSQPLRPVGSSFTIGSIILDAYLAPPVPAKKPKEVEEEMESDLLSATISNY